jgi:multimeric flavodoxin WrbA
MAVILGSPRKNGNSEKLADALINGATGYKAIKVYMHGLKVGGCVDCRRCWSNGSHCFLNDDMKEVYAALDDAEVIVFATPLYFYSWSAQIKVVWDRLLPYFNDNSKVSVKGRRVVLLATAGDTNEACFDGLKKSFELASGYCGWTIAGTLCVADVYPAGAIDSKKEALEKAAALGKSL